MTIGIVGRKVGMTRVFTDEGAALPVTVIEVEPNRITQLKTMENDGYRAVQVTTGERKSTHVNKPMAGHYAKANTAAGRGLWEFRLNDDEGEGFATGHEIKVDIFTAGQMVDVSGISIGKGNAGVIKRYHFAMQDATHGNSRAHRAPGSIGQRQTPGRVFLGKRMAGHMGDVKKTIQHLEVVRVDVERNLLLVKGAVPGAKNADVIVRPSVKAKKEKK